MSVAEDAQAALAAGLEVEIPSEEGFGPVTLDVPASQWADALAIVRSEVGLEFFDWLSAVDDLEDGFSVFAHLARLGAGVEHLLLRTQVPRSAPVLPSVVSVYAGAAWHERETHEMFGIDFEGNPDSSHLLLPDEFEGHPLRKDFVLASRVAKPWPGAKEPGESDATSKRAPSRRRMAPPGVPSPDEWGPRPPSEPPDPGPEEGDSS